MDTTNERKWPASVETVVAQLRAAGCRVDPRADGGFVARAVPSHLVECAVRVGFRPRGIPGQYVRRA